MIELSGGSVNILYSDGSSAVFDPEELRLRIGKSLSLAGFGDLWIADEIVLAVEYALRCRQNGDLGSVIHASEVDSCVARVLEDSGYASAAAPFYSLSRTSGDFGKLSPEKVQEYLTGKLSLAEENAIPLAEKVNQAMALLGIRRCSPHLVLELARHFREEEARKAQPLRVPENHTVLPKKSPAVSVSGSDTAWKIRLSETIFPSIRAEIHLGELFKNCTLTPPLTELSLTPIFLRITEQIDREYLHLSGEKEENYPLLLTLRGFQNFAGKYLCYEDGEEKVSPGKRNGHFVEFIRSLLLVKPFKIFLR